MSDDPYPARMDAAEHGAGQSGNVDRSHPRPSTPNFAGPSVDFAAYGLRPVELCDRELFSRFFSPLRRPLSDFTFSQIFTWRNSLHLSWSILAGHLCVFANGSGDLTMLIPPIGEAGGDGPGSDAALRQAFAVMDACNADHGAPRGASRVEYVSQELLDRFDQRHLIAAPMGADYVYDVARMIDLAGGDLASKRQAKNRFLRRYEHRVEAYTPDRHLEGCLSLLGQWRQRQDAQHQESGNSTQAVKRHKETLATELALRNADPLQLQGMVVYVREPGAGSGAAEEGWSLRGFTLGEPLGQDQSSIVIEKTDLAVAGLAQFIFSEFCQRHWSDRPLVNVGDDWGLESLAWTKTSYRPVQMLQKFTLTASAPLAVAVDGLAPQSRPALPCTPEAAAGEEPVIRPALLADLTATTALEQDCFSAELSIKKRQLRYLQRRPTAVCLVAEAGGAVVGEGIALVRQHRGRTASGRIYSLAVQHQHRRRHIGAKLLRAMVDQLRERGVRKVYLEVSTRNESAISLYERNGFCQSGRLPNYYGPQHDALHMVLQMKD